MIEGITPVTVNTPGLSTFSWRTSGPISLRTSSRKVTTICWIVQVAIRQIALREFTGLFTPMCTSNFCGTAYLDWGDRIFGKLYANVSSNSQLGILGQKTAFFGWISNILPESDERMTTLSSPDSGRHTVKNRFPGLESRC